MYNPEIILASDKKEALRENFLKGSSEEVRKAMIAYLGSAIDSGNYTDMQEFRFDGGMIVSVDFGLRNAKFSEKPNELPIIVQIEDGGESWETNWDELKLDVKEKILEKL